MTDIEKKYTIYKIVSKDLNINDCYVGSTGDFVRRKRGHKSNTTNEKRDGYNCTVYKFIRKNGGWKNWDMIELEIIECTKIESLKLERKYMDELEPTLNSYKSFITDEEKVENQKQYYIDNKEKLSKKFICNCGGSFTRRHRSAHFKTKKHQNYLLSKCAE